VHRWGSTIAQNGDYMRQGITVPFADNANPPFREVLLKRIRSLFVATACLTQVGCYHQVFNTGLAPSSTVVTTAWHPTWIFGLVAAQPIDVRTSCPGGVAIASTRMSFANGLVGGLTLGIFTPHEVKITCATRGAVLPTMETRHVAVGASRANADRVLADALESAARSAQSVAIVIDATEWTTPGAKESGR
jgi:hypothetical protein